MRINFKNKVLFSVLVLSAQLFVFTGTVQASIYKCVNAEGATFYNDKPCPKNDEETELDAVKDPVNGYIPPKFVEEKEVKGTKGVLIGESKGRELNSKKKEKSSESNSSSSASAGGNGSSDTNRSASTSSSKEAKSSSSSTSSENIETSSDSESELKISDIQVIDIEPLR